METLKHPHTVTPVPLPTRHTVFKAVKTSPLIRRAEMWD